jgi:tetraacyldisaccharide 4'-kinase
MRELKLFLLPLAFIYGLVAHFRNKLFDWGILKSQEFNIPIISLGNLSMGGTGKTPHIEYLITHLSQNYKIATLSRGYKRLSKGYRIAGESDNSDSIGDEPMQFYRKFPQVIVAVDEDRKNGINHLLTEFPDLDLILLDDAFQHRKVQPGMSILLTDYLQPFYNDHVFPAGTLREFKNGKKRADLVVVTKSPKILSPITKRTIIEQIKPQPGQNVFFSYIKYTDIVPLTKSAEESDKKSFNTILMVAGIANPYPLEEYLKSYCEELQPLYFPDHHRYTTEDSRRIKETFNNIVSRNKSIFTTEKDVMRLLKQSLLKEIEDLPVFYVPIAVEFHECSKSPFNTQILNYVTEAKRNR